jgi:RNA polymerase sigma factor (TIGR02999 family)
MGALMSLGSGAGSPGDVTRLLLAWREGDAAAPQQLFALVYDQLRLLARGQLRRRGPDHSLSATGLVHEAYLKLVGHQRLELRDRGHFFALAAKAMRQILVDRSRRRAAHKRGDPALRQPLDDAAIPIAARAEEILALDEALSSLERLDPRLARFVEVRFFAGLTLDEAAEALEISPRTAKRDWQKARAFLNRELASR